MSSRAYDVIVAADVRFPGGSSTGVASEIAAQAAAGYRTGLLMVKSPVLKRPHPMHPAVRLLIDGGACEIVDPDAVVECGLLALHHPQAFMLPPRQPLRITAEQRVLVVQHPPFDGAGRPAYDVAGVNDHLVQLTGERVDWAPTSPTGRTQLAATAEPPPMLAEDWVHIVDPAPWCGARSACLGELPVIGRHSRPDPLKWPETRDAVLQIYPDDPGVRVRILGGDKFLSDLVGTIPSNWDVLPFGSVEPIEFLRTIDFFVYYHHPDWIEAFGRVVIEAMASGCVPILPRSFEGSFGSGAIYAEPEDVLATVARLHRSPRQYGGRSRAAVATVKRRFGPAVHIERLRRLIGPPCGSLRPSGTRRPRRVLFFASNGVGIGHLTRLLAIARRCRVDVEPVFVTLSQAMGLVEQEGFLAEYVPFHRYLRCDVGAWNQHLAVWLREALAFYRPTAVVFDGHMPYGGLVDALRHFPQLWAVWCRRGLWRPGTGRQGMQRESAFDCVLEPADLAEAVDRGLTVEHRSRVRRVAPIRLVDGDEMLARGEARAALGSPASEGETWLLLALGAGNNFDYGPVWEACLARAHQEVDVRVFAALSPIADAPPKLPPSVTPLTVFPLARYLGAFDLAISAAGYNTYHELLLAGIPALFVPNENPEMDDQVGRALFADRCGWALSAGAREPYMLRHKLDQLFDPALQADMRRRMARLDRTNGAVEAARIIEEMAWTVRFDRAPA